MSLAMMALRISAVQALMNNTFVGDNVLDSQISAIDQTSDGDLSSDQRRPFVAVYSDAAKVQDLTRSGLRANGRVELTFNCGVSVTMADTNKETGETSIVDLFPATDANLEAVLDALDVQIARALADPNNQWAQVFGDLVQNYVSKEHMRSSSSAEGVRLAAGQMKLSVDVLADPPLGGPIPEGSVWERFLGLLGSSSLPQAQLIQQLIGAPGALSVRDVERLTGATVQDANSLRLYPASGVSAGSVITRVSGIVSAS